LFLSAFDPGLLFKVANAFLHLVINSLNYHWFAVVINGIRVVKFVAHLCDNVT